MQDASKRVATAPTATGIADFFEECEPSVDEQE
jgi:preprotein translocase subunit Sec61beta